MQGTRVGKRMIGVQSPVTVGWENIPRVQGGPVKQFVFTWFQPTMLFALLVLRPKLHRQGVHRHLCRNRLQGAPDGTGVAESAF